MFLTLKKKTKLIEEWVKNVTFGQIKQCISTTLLFYYTVQGRIILIKSESEATNNVPTYFHFK